MAREDTDPRAATVEAFLRLSRKRWQTADAATADLRQEWRELQLFAAGKNQWALEESTARQSEGRPCITINRIPQFLRLVENQQRASRSQIQISPRGGAATRDTANVLQGLIRSIEVESDADTAYDTACHHQLRIGFGVVRLRAEWASDTSFEQIIRLKRIRNPLAVYWDPSTQEAIWDDIRYAHVISAMGVDEYEARWGQISPYKSIAEFAKTDSFFNDWMPEGKVVVAEYYYTDIEPRELLQLEDGEVIWGEHYERWREAWQADYPDVEAPGVARSRQVKKRIVRWALHNAVEILEGNKDRTAGKEIPGSRIPLFPVVGDELDLDGNVEYRGMVHDGRDPQRLYNFWASSIAEAIALAPKAPWIAAAGQVEEYLDDWKEANRVAKSVLLYDPKSVDGNLVPPPQRNVAEPAIQAMVHGLMQANNDLQAVMGLYEPSLGDSRPDQSGEAIRAQQQQGVVANSNYLDNLRRTKRAVGRSLVEWIPVIYDTSRLVHLVSPDGKKLQAVVHAGPENAPDAGLAQREGVSGVFDLADGEYEVTVSMSEYATERERTQAWLMELFKVLPGLAAVGADILLENSDDPAAMQLAKRAKAMLPPQVQAEDDPQSAALAATQAGQLKAQFAALQAEYQQALDIIRTKKIETSSRERIAIIQAQANLAAVAAKIGSAGDMAAFQAEFERHQRMMDTIDAKIEGDTSAQSDATLQASSQAHEAALAAQAHVHALAQADQAHQHATAQGQQQADQAASAQATDHANTIEQLAAAPPPAGGAA